MPVPAQAYAGLFLTTFKDFPLRDKASGSIIKPVSNKMETPR